VLLPVLLIVLALAAAAIMAFGTNADLAQYHRGLEMILFTRRLQWPLVAFSLLCCIILIVLVIANKRRAWWLIALGPITALFAYRFSLSADNFWSIADNPPMLSADTVTFVGDDDWVVGVNFEDQAYALPYQSLYSTPVLILHDRDKRMMVMWSPFANVARAYNIDREIKSRELDIVSMPANALLIYNTRVGQFINGITGLTSSGVRPSEFKTEIPTIKTTWKKWRALYPESKVLVASGRLAHNPPAAPVLPIYQLPHDTSDGDAHQRVVVVPTTQPIAIPTEAITNRPMNVMAGKLPVLLFRDAATGEIKAFDRRLDEDLMPRFEVNHDPRRKNVALVDSDTLTGWSLDGIAIDGAKDRKGKKLRTLPVEEDVYWGVMKFWYPNLKLDAGDLRVEGHH
jgi:hypothetical protein